MAGGEAFFQGRDRLRMMTRAIEGDAQRVEINRLPCASRTAWRACSRASVGFRSGSGPVAKSQARLLRVTATSGDRRDASRSTSMASPILPACSNCRACSRSDCTSPPETPMSTMSFKGAAGAFAVTGSVSGYAGRPSRGPARRACRGWPAGPRHARPGPSWVVTTRRDPSGLKVANATPHRSGLSSRAIVRPVSVSTRRRILLGPQRPPGGRRGKSSVPRRRFAALAPGADCPEPARRMPRHEPFPVGAEGDRRCHNRWAVRHCAPSRSAPDLDAAE